MFNIILNNIHEVFIVNVSSYFNVVYCKFIFKLLHQKFIIYLQSDINEEEYEDEYTNRIATYLLTMQILIISSKKFRKKALFDILQTINDKKINLGLYLI